MNASSIIQNGSNHLYFPKILEHQNGKYLKINPAIGSKCTFHKSEDPTSKRKRRDQSL